MLDAVERIKVKPGEFYFIPAGMLHSIGSGVLVYETMQSSDISYRVYDYERNRTDGSSLEVKKALDVIQFTANAPAIVPETTIVENHKRSQIVSNDYPLRRQRQMCIRDSRRAGARRRRGCHAW